MPKLRFPEFRDAPVWDETTLEDVGQFVKKKMPLNELTLKTYVSTENLLPEYGGFSIASKLPQLGTVTGFKQQDILISNIRPYLRKVWLALFDGGASNDVVVIRSKNNDSSEFLAFLLMNDEFIGYVMKGAKGVKMPRGDVSLMRKYPLAVPSKVEQQKIATCLTSIDELIATRTQKLGALKAHKKGLMQRLFPAEGETVPNLRFPEFRDAPEWKEKRAGTLFINRTEEGVAGLPIYSVTMNDGMIKRALLDRHLEDIAKPEGNKKAYKNDIVYNMMRMWQGAFGVVVEDCMVSPAYVILAPRDRACSNFFGYLLKLPRYLRLLACHSQGLTSDRLRLYYKDFARIPLLCPAFPEQQKIAYFLSSIDELIAAQTQKIESLKSHKKGLMQQLFPVVEEEDR